LNFDDNLNKTSDNDSNEEYSELEDILSNDNESEETTSSEEGM